MKLADQYFLKALDSFNWSSSESLESLNYALSYDQEHAPSLCLLARMYMLKLKDYDAAAHYFEMALLTGSEHVDIYKYYSLLLIWLGEFQKADKLIRKASKVKGMPQTVILRRRAKLYEYMGKVDYALAESFKGRLLSDCDYDYDYFGKEIKRLRRKIKTREGLKITMN